MMEKEYGLVLKRFLPNQQKLSVLTPSMGKINLIVKKTHICQRIWPGMVVAFNTQPTNYSAYSCDDVEIMSAPMFAAQEDMYWVHHLLELCFHFIPQESPNRHQFGSVSYYLTFLQHKELFEATIEMVKIVCIVHFLQDTGFFSDDTLIYYQGLLQTLNALVYDQSSRATNIENLIAQINRLTSYDVQKLNKYIFNCLKDHPSFNLFKTINFVYPS